MIHSSDCGHGRLSISLDAKSAAEILNVSPRHLQRMAAQGKIPAFRVGKLWRFNRAAIERLAGIERDGWE